MKHILKCCFSLLFLFHYGNSFAQNENPLPTAANEPVYDVAPQFPGGPDSLQAYFKRTIQYPETQLTQRPKGNVQLKFVVTKKGKIKDVAPVNGVPGAPEFVPEAIRTVLLMPEWKPATKNGKPIDTEYFLNVPFAAPD